MMDGLTTTWHKGKLVTGSVLWFWTKTNYPYDELHCVHNMKLSEKCDACNKDREMSR